MTIKYESIKKISNLCKIIFHKIFIKKRHLAFLLFPIKMLSLIIHIFYSFFFLSLIFINKVKNSKR